MVRTYSPTVDIVKQTVSAQTVNVAEVPVESVEFIDATQAGNVASGNNEIVTIQPPSGYIYELLIMQLYCPADADATTGTHTIRLKSESRSIPFLLGKSVYSSEVNYGWGTWKSADSTQLPPNDTEQLMSPRTLRIDNTNGFIITYVNNLDVAQENDREYRLWVRKIKVA